MDLPIEFKYSDPILKDQEVERILRLELLEELPDIIVSSEKGIKKLREIVHKRMGFGLNAEHKKKLEIVFDLIDIQHQFSTKLSHTQIEKVGGKVKTLQVEKGAFNEKTGVYEKTGEFETLKIYEADPEFIKVTKLLSRILKQEKLKELSDNLYLETLNCLHLMKEMRKSVKKARLNDHYADTTFSTDLDKITRLFDKSFQEVTKEAQLDTYLSAEFVQKYHNAQRAYKALLIMGIRDKRLFLVKLGGAGLTFILLTMIIISYGILLGVDILFTILCSGMIFIGGMITMFDQVLKSQLKASDWKKEANLIEIE